MRKVATISALLAAGVALFVALASTADAQTTSCGSFSSRAQAQAFYNAHKNDTPGNPDPYHMDADGDGVVCENYPYAAAPAATVAPAVVPTSTPAPLGNTGAETGVMAMSGISLLEAGYGMTLLARRFGVKRRNVPTYLMRKLVSAGKSGQTGVALGDDIYLVHESAFAPTIYEPFEWPDEERFELEEPESDEDAFAPLAELPRVSLYAALAKGAEIDEPPPPIIEEAVVSDLSDDDDDFAWRV